MTAQNDRKQLLAALSSGINAAPSNSAKWKPLKEWFSERFGAPFIVDKKDAEGKNITSENQVWNRIHNELAGIDPKYAAITAVNQSLLPSIHKHLETTEYPRARAFVLLVDTKPVELQVYQPDAVTKALEAMFPELTPQYIKRPEHTTPSGTTQVHPPPTATIPILVDDRVRRMVVLSIRSSSAVILVGPPGTGKTTLLDQIVADIQVDPKAYGFAAVADPIRATPEESWTTTDLVGGQTVSETQDLRFRPGLVLQAINEDRWLILDEVNRADMDKIFGGLLTWLSSNEDVDLGPVSTHVDSARVTLGWTAAPGSVVENAGNLTANHPTGEAVRFRAGSEWRLLGTYNAVDAQRVFRFGAALGRRFARVPIPAPSVPDFDKAVTASTNGLPAKVHIAVVGLYAAHHKSDTTRLGPALFMRIPHYVKAGLTGQQPTSTLVDQLIAEGYLVSVGTWIAKLRTDDRDLLGDEILNNQKALPSAEWDWLVRMTAMLG